MKLGDRNAGGSGYGSFRECFLYRTRVDVGRDDTVEGVECGRR